MSVPPPPRPRSPLRQLGFIDRPIANRVDDEYSIIRLGTRRKAKKKERTRTTSPISISETYGGGGAGRFVIGGGRLTRLPVERRRTTPANHFIGCIIHVSATGSKPRERERSVAMNDAVDVSRAAVGGVERSIPDRPTPNRFGWRGGGGGEKRRTRYQSVTSSVDRVSVRDWASRESGTHLL